MISKDSKYRNFVSGHKALAGTTGVSQQLSSYINCEFGRTENVNYTCTSGGGACGSP